MTIQFTLFTFAFADSVYVRVRFGIREAAVLVSALELRIIRFVRQTKGEILKWERMLKVNTRHLQIETDVLRGYIVIILYMHDVVLLCIFMFLIGKKA